MSDTSHSLLARLKSSSAEESWRQLVELYTPLLRRWLQNYRVQAADCDDLLQEVLTAVVCELPRFEHNSRCGAFRNWLRKILVNRLRGYWRDRDHRPAATGGSDVAADLAALEDDASRLSQQWAAEHDREVLGRLLERVRPRFQAKTWEAFHRQMFQSQRADQVAAELEMPLSSVYTARSRVLSALREEASGLVDSV